MWLFLKNHQHRAHVQHKLLLLLLQVIQNLDGASTSGQWQTLAQGSLVYPVYVKKSKMYINKLPTVVQRTWPQRSVETILAASLCGSDRASSCSLRQLLHTCMFKEARLCQTVPSGQNMVHLMFANTVWSRITKTLNICHICNGDR